jgi:hypothetical protein
LAYALGYAEPDQMMEEMSPQTWLGWKAYNARSPVNLPRRLDYLFAMLAKTVADFSMVLNRENHPDGVDMNDFLLSWKTEEKPQQLTVEQSTAWIVGLAELLGAADLRGQR